MRVNDELLIRPGDSAERVHDQLRIDIIEQRLRPGARLSEAALADRFAVSRTVVRAALERLTGDGLVERANNRSARVPTIGLEDAADLLDIRQRLETMVVERLAHGLSDDAQARLERHLALERNASSLNRPEAVRLAGEFHVLLADLTGSVQLRRFISDLVSRSSLILTTHGRPHSSSCAVREHEDIVRLLMLGEGTSATSCMRAHLSGIAERAGLLTGSGRQD